MRTTYRRPDQSRAVLFDLADLAPVLVELDDEVAGYACGGVLRVLCGGVGLEHGFRRDLDEELDVAAHDGYVIGLAVTEDDIGVAYVQLAVERGVRRVRRWNLALDTGLLRADGGTVTPRRAGERPAVNPDLVTRIARPRRVRRLLGW